ncbi:MAG: helix-hairpin-helix domain-containing protein [Verrucomicrobiae bacterium]|nr:helix-hairpin-helix domain-containing protein [Verrucomicrobiae bacterium]
MSFRFHRRFSFPDRIFPMLLVGAFLAAQLVISPEPSLGEPKPKASAGEDSDQASLKTAEAMLKTLSGSKKGALTRLLNSGKKEDLMQLPGVGETTADRIIAARPFKNSSYLILVKGIGEKTFSNIVQSRK